MMINLDRAFIASVAEGFQPIDKPNGRRFFDVDQADGIGADVVLWRPICTSSEATPCALTNRQLAFFRRSK